MRSPAGVLEPAAIEYPPELPICSRREEILAALRTEQVLIIAGETGSGKTTQLPKMCVEAGLNRRGKIGCTQPRRVAAQSVSRRVAEELKVTWGREVGCKMRFNDDTGRETQVKFMTDGILLAEIQSDPMLRAYSCLILDEAHERSLNIDFLLGYLKGLLQRRPDLKLIVTSATIDTQAFSAAFGGAKVIEVSGRLFPVEIRYACLGGGLINEKGEGDGGDELSYLETAAQAVEEALIETDSGDVLVFMPTERDIRDTRELLQESLGPNYEVIGLFGRMPAAEQQKIFAPGGKRRVIVATNIAETSITIPRIRYVIDAGLARISRYSPRTRTKRLPIEPVSQSSANQRAGRAGRLQDGVCVRLYSEEDYLGRPQFTQPEIQRANLAEVILRMKAFRLGDIESFPFINPPQAQAIRAGYILLHELGALDELNELTPLGRELARLPVDPTFGRMLLQARKEGALPEVLVIAAGLSVPDPRERPEEQKEAAAAAHRAFSDSDSDFLSLLNIWRAAPDDAKASRNAFRRFCKSNFLSQSRMREWRDIFRQLCEAMGEERRVEVAREPQYEPIHRSILSGLLGQIAQRKERNSYQAAGNRLVTIFPGSNLYARKENKTKPLPHHRDREPAKGEKVSQPAWIVCGEIVQTSQLFARMIAAIDPLWAVDLGPHLCRHRYSEPHWSAKAGRVLATERILVHGLELSHRQIDYGRINPVEATELFIRGALVAEEAKIPLKFFVENSKLRKKIETVLTRVRSRLVLNIDHSLYRFYSERIENISSVHDLNRFVKGRLAKEPNFLCATEEDLIEAEQSEYDRSLFPDQVSLGNAVLPISYSYDPGEEADGVTVKVPLPVADRLTSGQLQWIVPGLREEIASVLLRALPKTLRKPLMPLEPKAKEIAREFDPGQSDFLEAFAQHLRRRYRADVRPQDWPPETIPSHLRPRVEVIAPSNQVVAAGRDLEAIRTRMDQADLRSDAWIKAAKQWERQSIEQNFEDLPESVVVEQVGGVPLLAYPGFALRAANSGAETSQTLKAAQGGQPVIGVRLFRSREEAELSSRAGIRALAELTLSRDLGWLGKELRILGRKPQSSRPSSGFQEALSTLATPKSPAQREIDPEALQKAAYEHIIRHRFALEPVFPLTRSRFNTMVESVRRELPMLARKICEATNQTLEFRAKLLQAGSPRYPGMEADLERLVPSDFLARTSPANLAHLPRYLRAIQVRAERARINPAKDSEKAKQLAAFTGWEKRVKEDSREAFRWMLEEFRVSLFAQELGTAQPVSAQRLQKLLGE